MSAGAAAGRRVRATAVALLVGIGIAVWWMQRGGDNDQIAVAPPRKETPAKMPAAPRTTDADAASVDELAARLLAPDGDAHTDIQILDALLEHWATNFPRQGNPVGTNAEITRALTGENALQFALLPRDHRAINREGELCDRWGTPFRFHQLSGRAMEIVSAGPDRDFATADDVSNADTR